MVIADIFTNKSIHLINYNCNLNDASGQWNNIILENCFISLQNNSTKFKNTILFNIILVKLNKIYNNIAHVQMEQQSVQQLVLVQMACFNKIQNNMINTFDFNPLQMSSKLTVEIDKDVITDFRSLIQCRPNIVQLYYHNIDLKQLSGTWNDLLFANCEFANSDNYQINAKTVKIFDPDIQNFGAFICDQQQDSHNYNSSE
ncbi:Hypothetical_protein [Hexamita inflata]|uniref:Hypothetical_protein n=1 Tax=Hexamita inflata TaxID=28002 RepID=A0AA86PJX0_9EUKA|nr:Hypothetical protein HINF_LOCUS28579 [Hexamita inflata]